MTDCINSVIDVKEYKNFSLGKKLIINYLSNLLNCDVKLQEQPLKDFCCFISIDILENIKRNVYVLDKNRVVLVSKVYNEKKQIVGVLPILLEGTQISSVPESLLNKIANSLTGSLSESFKESFKEPEKFFTSRFQIKTMWDCIATSLCNLNRFRYLIEYVQKLALLTFEDSSFSTGFIMSQSIYDYVSEKQHNRGGVLFNLNTELNITKEIEPKRRFWYLIDGMSSYYLFDNTFTAKCIYTIPEQNSIKKFWDSYSMKTILWGTDVAFRTTKNHQISIINKNGIEFFYTEGIWRLRDYNRVINVLKENTKLEENKIDELLYFVLYCSNNRKSTIIWLPCNCQEEELKKSLTVLNKITKESISLGMAENRNFILRLLTSDGVTILNSEGSIIYSGCVVNLSKQETVSGLTGTGETAARILAGNGIAIKTSQDGIVKIFINKTDKPYIF